MILDRVLYQGAADFDVDLQQPVPRTPLTCVPIHPNGESQLRSGLGAKWYSKSSGDRLGQQPSSRMTGALPERFLLSMMNGGCAASVIFVVSTLGLFVSEV